MSLPKTTNTQPLAVVTRTKDRTYLLERAIKSLDAQTDQRFMHIIINDGGDKELVESIVANNPRSDRVVVHNKEPRGLVAALNQGISLASTTYISILDDDDTWHTEHVERVLDHFEQNAECAACVVKMDLVIEDEIDGSLKTIEQSLYPESGDGQISLYKQCISNYISNGVVTYKKMVYDELGGYDESLTIGEDWDFGIQLLMKYDVDFIDTKESMVFYHQRPKVVDGAASNSVHSGGAYQQEVMINKIRNKYLRIDLAAGKIGPGYIMNQEEYDLRKVVRLEGHVNRSLKEGKDHVDAVPNFQRSLKGLISGITHRSK